MVHGKYGVVCDAPPKTQPEVGLLLPDDNPQTRAQVAAAYGCARELYGSARRQDGVRVMDHAYDVARNAIRFGCRDVELIIAALLHDVLETTDTPAAEVERSFGPRVARLVVALTHEPGEDPATSARRAVQAGPDGLFLRLCDRLDGLRHAAQRRDRNSRRHFLTATREVYLPLAAQHFPAIAEEMREVLTQAEGASAQGAGSRKAGHGDG